MAQEPENPHGRMLFTDFDVSGKGRPVAVLPGSRQTDPLSSPLHSITELASTLELDFEDDDSTPEPWQSKPPSPMPEAKAETKQAPRMPESRRIEDRPPENVRPEAPTPESGTPEDELPFGAGLAIPQWPAASHTPPAAPTASAAPTWAEYANAFRSRNTRIFAKSEPGETAAPAAPLSAASIFAAFRHPSSSRAPNAGANEGASTAPTAAYLAVPDDGEDGDFDFDILSSIPTELVADDTDPYEPAPLDPGAAADPAKPARKTRPILRAPDTPYGGLTRIEDWYAPPENQPEKPLIPTDWYELPEEIAAGSGGGSAKDDISDFLNSDMFSTGSGEGGSPYKTSLLKSSRAAKQEPEAGQSAPGRTRPSPADTLVDLFSNLDIDGEWKARVAATPSRPAASDTAILGKDGVPLDLFSDVDLETAWHERQASSGTTGGETKKLLSAGDTVILEGSTLGKSGFDAPKKASRTEAKPKPASKPEQPAVMEFLEDDPVDEPAGEDVAEESMEPSAAQSAAKGVTKTATKTAASKTKAAPREKSSEYYLDVMDEVEEEDGAKPDTVAPQIDDSAIQTDPRSKKQKKAKGADGPLVSTLPGDIDVDLGEAGDAAQDEDADDSAAAPAAESAVSEEDNQTADALFDADADAHKNHAEFPAAPHRSTDDLLQDIDFDDLGVNAAISAPVIDDSDIDAPAPGPRPGTEEMQAITGEADFSENPEAEAAVPVNPADVFANMDDMDFSDDMDDDMRAMLDESVAEIEGEGGAVAEGAEGSILDRQSAVLPAAPPKGFVAKMRYHALKTARKIMPFAFFQKLGKMIGWSENWWFYCDLVAAIIASASMAVIISYYIWYRK